MRCEIRSAGVMGGHGDGANAIPSVYALTPELKAYREGTAMRRLAEALAELPGVVNLRPEADDIPWKERAARAKAAGVELCAELHTNWSVNSAGTPNNGVFLVIVPLYNPIHGVDEQKAMAETLFAPLAEAMGMRFEIRTKKGGGEWDWYSFLNECNRQRIPWPMIVEHGYHVDFAPDVDGNIAKVKARWAWITGDEQTAPAEPGGEPADAPDEADAAVLRYMVHAGAYADKAAAQAASAAAQGCGFAGAYAHSRGGVYFARCSLNGNIEYAMGNAEYIRRETGLEAGIIII